MSTEEQNLGIDIPEFSWDDEKLPYPDDPAKKQEDGKTKTSDNTKSTTIETGEEGVKTEEDIEFRTEMEKHFSGETSEEGPKSTKEEEAAESEETSEEQEEAEDPTVLQEVFNILEEQGLAEFDMEELGELDSDDKIVQALTDSVQARINAGIENYINRVPENVANIVKVALNGGDVHSFIKKYYADPVVTDLRKVDISSEEGQVSAMRVLLKEEGYDASSIEAQIDIMRDSAQLEKMAKVKYDLWKSKKEAEEAAELQNSQRAVAENKRRLAEAKQQYEKVVTSKDGVDGITFTPKEKKTIASYIMDRNIPIEGGGVVSPIEAQLKQVFADPGQTAVLAKLLMRMKDNKFDFSFLEKKAKTEATKKVRKAFTRRKTTNNKSESLMGDFDDIF